MKYNPEFIKKYPEVWNDYETSGRYLSLSKFIPSAVKGKSHFKCTIGGRKFITEDGAYNHIDVKHEKEILKAIKG